MEFMEDLYLRVCERLLRHNMQVAARLKADKKHCNNCGWKSAETEIICPMCREKKVQE